MKKRYEISSGLYLVCLFQVVMNVGLCIALWDITKLGDSHIIPGDECCHTLVHFRYVVFRPFMTEILIGKVKSCNREGVNGNNMLPLIFRSCNTKLSMHIFN